MDTQKIQATLSALLENQSLTKLIMSKPQNTDVKKAVYKFISLKNEPYLQEELFLCDNKVLHKNIEFAQAHNYLFDTISTRFKQADLFAEHIQCQILRSKKGSLKLIGNYQALLTAKQQGLSTHNKEKSYLLPDGIPIPFLVRLGVMNPDGKVLKAKMDKFKQINRFLEFVDDIKEQFPKQGDISVIDFGCGKSYLTFAVHYYITQILGRQADIVGIDLKPDVIELCNRIASELSLDGIRFIRGNINTYIPPNDVTMTISLHACDTATDFALNQALAAHSKLIISVPCCHHELADKIRCDELQPILEHGILAQHFADLATDALRAKFLQAHGYKVQVLEFIDAGHTPKNVMIRAVKHSNFTQQQAKKAKAEYMAFSELIGASPSNLHL